MRMNKSGVSTFLLSLGLTLSNANAQTTMLPSFADLVDKINPAIVNISTTQKQTTLNGGDIIDPQNNPIDQNHYTLGSGFILEKDGYILTNKHVIDNAETINVELADKTQHKATVVGSDDKTDLALIKISPQKDLQTAKLGDSDKVRVGDWVLTVGNPFGLGGSVSAGIVSAKSRDIESGPYDNFIQTDASINQGNSGGPMFDLSGNVIGINTAIFSTTGGNMGVGFAIPINNAKFVIEQLQKHGEVQRGWIGMRIQQQISEATSRTPQGVVVSSVVPDSPAAKANIQAGDIVTAMNQKEIGTSTNFARLVSEASVGSQITLTLWKNNKTETAVINVEEMPEKTDQTSNISTPEKDTMGEILNKAMDKEEKQETQNPLVPLTKENKNVSDKVLAEEIKTSKDAEQGAVKEDEKTEEKKEAKESNLDIDSKILDIPAAPIGAASSFNVTNTGLTIRNIEMKDIQEQHVRPDIMGVTVEEVDPTSEASIQGFRAGQIITQINGKTLYSVDSVKAAVEEAESAPENNIVKFTVLDNGRAHNITMRIIGL